MKQEDFTKTIQDIRTKVSDSPELSEVSDLLTNLFDGSTELFKTIDDLSSTKKELEKSNENLRNTNMKLFLKIGEQDKKEEDPTPIGENPPIEKRSFDNLFKEGGIK